jgi:hypothetical protein
MLALYRALSAELLKTKRTLAFWLTLLAPLPIILLALINFMQDYDWLKREELWSTLIHNVFVLWNVLLSPLFITLETGLLNALEHHNKMRKQLYALPAPRWAMYAAKQLVALGLIGLSNIALAAMTVSVGLVLRVLRPNLSFGAPVPWAPLLQSAVLGFLASCLIISLHLWVSARWSSFVAAMGAGIVTTVAGVVVINSEWAKMYPWTLPGWVVKGNLQGEGIVMSLALGLAGGIVVALAGGWNVIRRDVL